MALVSLAHPSSFVAESAIWLAVCLTIGIMALVPFGTHRDLLLVALKMSG